MINRSSIIKYTIIGVVALLAVFGVLYWFGGWAFIALFESIFRGLFHIIAPTVVAGIIAAIIYWRSKSVTASIVIMAVAVLGALAYSIFRYTYEVQHSYAVEAKTVETTTDYADRAPWVVANNFAQRDQGDIIGDRLDAHNVPASADASAAGGDGTSRYTVLIKGRGFLGMAGYEGIQTMSMPTTGPIPAGASGYCEMPDSMDKRIGNLWHNHNLTPSIAAKRPNVHFNPDDMYGYCDADGKPIVVIPLFEYNGLWHVTKAPAGVATYTEDGVEVYDADEVADLGLAGPTYPRSLAIMQRKSINAGGTWGQWFGSVYGYETTDKDDDDANKGNTTEFTLIDGNGETQYVTPLTPRGSSQSLTAVLSVSATQTGSQRNPVVVNTSTDLPATSNIMTSIKESSVRGDNRWTTRWSVGMTVYEILPGQNGHWVASIGQGQAVSYRADIAPDGSVTVTNTETGNTSNTDESVTVTSDKPLSEMTDEELLVQIQTATEELQRRQT